MNKIAVGVLGATGRVGMHYVHLLAHHPHFRLVHVAASESSCGRRYSEVVKDKWPHAALPPDLVVADLASFNKECALIFSALSSSAALEWEEAYARAGFGVISNASAHRNDIDVPLIIPEVNPDHLNVLELQRKRRGWDGFIVCKPNCSVQSYLIPLAPLHKQFGVKKVFVTMLQALSGDGSSFADNVIPYIANEEEKSQQEPLKIWGKVTEEGIVSEDSVVFSAHCNRVPVANGHLACVSVAFANKPTLEEIRRVWRGCSAIHYREENDRPQPCLDRDADGGMGVTVGRLRPCPLFDFRFAALSHNTVRGAAGGALLTAELLLTQGFLSHAKTQSDICQAQSGLSLSGNREAR